MGHGGTERMNDQYTRNKDFIGKQFGRLTVIEQDKNRKNSHDRYWICKCECGNIKSVTTGHLTAGTVRSCGCIRNEQAIERFKEAASNNVKHNGCNDDLYYIWKGIRQRCNNKKSPAYRWYGAKGVKICDEWDDYSKFKEWAENNGYIHDKSKTKAQQLSIDRIDSEGDYCPENCRWITLEANMELARERRGLMNVPYEAEEQKVFFEWVDLNMKKYPELFLCYHVANGGKRNAIEAKHLQEQGVRAGVPDICFPVAKKGYHGLFIELKREKGGKTSKFQDKWIDMLNSYGYLAVVAKGATEAIKVISDYLKG